MTRAFELTDFFAGQIRGTGAFINVWTGYRRGFTVDMKASLEGGTLRIVEDFVFEDGETDCKTWVLTQTAPRHWQGRREDTVGIACVTPDGDALRLTYRLALPASALGTVSLACSDLMRLARPGHMVSHSTVRKWGIAIARIEVELHKEAAVLEPPKAQAAAA